MDLRKFNKRFHNATSAEKLEGFNEMKRRMLLNIMKYRAQLARYTKLLEREQERLRHVQTYIEQLNG